MRKKIIRLCLLPLLSTLALISQAAQVATENAPDFNELRELVRQHLVGATDAEINRASVEGFLDSLRGKVRLIGGTNDVSAPTNASAISKVTVFDDHIAYLRIGQVSAQLPVEIRRQCQSLSATNKLVGLILDLRFANGDDYAAAAATADLFVSTPRSLLDWGTGAVKSAEKADALSWPVAVLVNSETIGAAEALAAVLREVGVGLILGGTTRGAAMTTEDFSLKNGHRLRIATSPVKLGDGAAISTKGVKPDIEVVVAPEAELVFLDDPYASTTRTNSSLAATSLATATNRPARRTRPNEADLVRARRDGLSLDGDFPLGRDGELEKPVLRDPTLARAIDLLKGLAIVRRARA